MEKVPTRAFFWFKAQTSTLIYDTMLNRHYNMLNRHYPSRNEIGTSRKTYRIDLRFKLSGRDIATTSFTHHLDTALANTAAVI